MGLTDFAVLDGSYGQTSYLVANGIDDVTDTSHNNQTNDIQALAQRLSLNYGNGIDGQGVMGSLTDPSATLTASTNGTGNLTGSFRYRVSFYNLSGETLPTADPGSDQVTATANKVLIQNIPVSSQTALITGRKVYRSADGGTTYTLIATIPDNVTTSFTDNNDITTGASIPTSNTTGATGTLTGGEYNFTSLSILVSQTLNISDNTKIRVLGNVSIAGSVIGASVLGGLLNGLNGAIGTNRDNHNGIVKSTQLRHVFGNQGNGGAFYGNGASLANAGVALAILAKGDITLSTATITLNASATTTNQGGGGAGGVFCLASLGQITATGTISCNGADGGIAGSTVGAGGGGGGGFVSFIANQRTITSTNNVNSGLAGTGIPSTDSGGGGNGGSCGGRGGKGGVKDTASTLIYTAHNGSAGVVLSKSLYETDLGGF